MLGSGEGEKPPLTVGLLSFIAIAIAIVVVVVVVVVVDFYIFCLYYGDCIALCCVVDCCIIVCRM